MIFPKNNIVTNKSGYAAYAPLSRNPQLVHNIHVGPDARISAAQLGAKCARGEDRAVRIAYGGRVHPDKGVEDWIEVLSRVAADGGQFVATWHGSGPLLETARAMVAARGLEGRIRFPGATAGHGELLAELREADICLFCHKTPESPRALIEALLSAAPIVGYDSSYPRDLISDHGGGVLTPLDDVAALAESLAGLIADRPRLKNLIDRAARDGYPMVDENVFRHRSDLMKTHLGPF